jgi:hypothetical protein
LQHIYIKYKVMDFLNSKTWINFLSMALYEYIFLYGICLGYLIKTQYMIYYNQKNLDVKVLLLKNLTQK